ncbi:MULTISPECIES: ABC transporter permease subunit [unclassified Paludibacterium]|uniref:ABC transporter permease subunit n=1 Tax=unclassified Paludibacterium TaxID=2618429 RepID=UPI001C04F86A|nr:ABC transporter permease subunit [Paludibacterium sp. B53371]BEV72666.1 glycine betaine ABC transporter permease YehW [Paludibacterium sp. THUN1379]
MRLSIGKPWRPLLGCLCLLLIWLLLFPGQAGQGFATLLWYQLSLAAAASGLALLAGVGLGVLVTRPQGRAWRPLLHSLLAMLQWFPPLVLLAVAALLMGGGVGPALLALMLGGMLPVAQATLDGLDAVPEATREVGRAIGMTHWQRLWQIELPLAAPVMLGGMRRAVMLILGGAALAATLGTSTLGLPIIAGLSGFQAAPVFQAAVLLVLLALCVDQLFELLAQSLSRQVPGDTPT